jgi:hypothetical protein
MAVVLVVPTITITLEVIKLLVTEVVFANQEVTVVVRMVVDIVEEVEGDTVVQLDVTDDDCVELTAVTGST